MITATLLLYLRVNNADYIQIHHYNSMYVIVVIVVPLPVITYYLVFSIIVTIPPPVIYVTTTGTGVIGESYSVVCTVDVDDDLYSIFANTTIVKIGEGVVNSSEDDSVSISYTPLMTSHSGQYQCVVDISYEDSYFAAFTIHTASKYNTLYLVCSLLYTCFM